MYIAILIHLLIPLNVLCFDVDFLLFENFELTKKSFVEEQSVFKSMAKVRNILNDAEVNLNNNNKASGFESIINMEAKTSNKNRIMKQEIIQGINHRDGSESTKYRVRQYFLNQYRSMKMKHNFTYTYETVYKELEKINIVKSALSGVLLLRETFEQNITDFSKGDLCLKNTAFSSSRRIDSLKIEDLATMSKIAFNQFNYYDSAIEYLKAATLMFYNEIGSMNASVSRTIEELLILMKRNYPSYHNEMLSKMDSSVGINWKLYPVMVDEDTLEPITNETTPLDLSELTLQSIKEDRVIHERILGAQRMPLFQKVCNKKIQGIGHSGPERRLNGSPRCHFLHHFSPSLMIGPFHLEVKLYIPFRTIIHDFLTDEEISWIIEYIKPGLSASRKGQVPKSTTSLTKSELRNYKNDTAHAVAKAVTKWLPEDILYHEEQLYKKVNAKGTPLKYEALQLQDPYSYSIQLPNIYSLSKKIEKVTNLNVTSRFSATKYQATNYGLSGMVVEHLDPWGYEHGVNIIEERKSLTQTGDYIATFMGYLKNTEAGGGTAFPTADVEGLLEPEKGSAAFWFNMFSSHYRDTRAAHGGCPVLKGDKWILNKWINSWDQWRAIPCHLESNIEIPSFDGITL